MRLMLAFGLAFLLPVLMVALNFAGVGTRRDVAPQLALGGARRLRLRRRHDPDARTRSRCSWSPCRSAACTSSRSASASCTTVASTSAGSPRGCRRSTGTCPTTPPRRDRVTRLGVVVNPTAGKGRGTAAGRRTHELLQARGYEVEDLSCRVARAGDRPRAWRRPGGARRARRRRRRRHGAPRGQRRRRHRTCRSASCAAGTGNDIARTLGLPAGRRRRLGRGDRARAARRSATRRRRAGRAARDRRARVVPRRAVVRLRRRDQRARQRDDLAQGVRPVRARAAGRAAAGSSRTGTA